VFTFYNANPKNRFTTDCVIRAISTALEIPYNQVVMEMAELQCNTGYDPSESITINKYLESKGWVKNKQPKKPNNTKYTGTEFCMNIANANERYIANIGGHHIIAIINKKIHDTWDSSQGCIGNYWIRKEM